MMTTVVFDGSLPRYKCDDEIHDAYEEDHVKFPRVSWPVFECKYMLTGVCQGARQTGYSRCSMRGPRTGAAYSKVSPFKEHTFD